VKTTIFLMAVLAVAPVYAQLGSQSFGRLSFGTGEITDAELNVAEGSFQNPGLMPDNPLYVFKRFGEGMRLMFAFDENSRSRLHTEFAAARLAELKKLVEENKTVDRQTAEFEHEVSALSSANSSGVREMLRKSSIVLAMVAEKVPENSRPAIERAMEASCGNSGALRNSLQEILKERDERATEQIRNAEEQLEEARSLANGSVPMLMMNAEDRLATAKNALNRNDFGEAFGQANSAEHMARKLKEMLEDPEDSGDPEDID
jgi:hypothetical protein